ISRRHRGVLVSRRSFEELYQAGDWPAWRHGRSTRRSCAGEWYRPGRIISESAIEHVALEQGADLRQAGILFRTGRQSGQLKRLPHLGAGTEEVHLWQSVVSLLAYKKRHRDLASE